jgi:hypothetical protein
MVAEMVSGIVGLFLPGRLKRSPLVRPWHLSADDNRPMASGGNILRFRYELLDRPPGDDHKHSTLTCLSRMHHC